MMPHVLLHFCLALLQLNFSLSIRSHEAAILPKQVQGEGSISENLQEFTREEYIQYKETLKKIQSTPFPESTAESSSLFIRELDVTEGRRKLIRDADKSRTCFVDIRMGNNVYYSSYADYLTDPFKANNDRGDWGKCLPEELFGLMCEHEYQHMLNDQTWTPGDGPLHDEASEQLFLHLRRIHNDYCIHVDLDIPEEVQAHFNDYLHARGDYVHRDKRIVQSIKEVHVYFAVTDIDGKYFLNGFDSPMLTFLRSMTYQFDLTSVPTKSSFQLATMDGSPITDGVTFDGDTNSLFFTAPIIMPDQIQYLSVDVPDMGNVINVVLYEMPGTPEPTVDPTEKSTTTPTADPTIKPTRSPTAPPTTRPSPPPTLSPTHRPTRSPTVSPTYRPSSDPTIRPTAKPTVLPTVQPSRVPTNNPTTRMPTISPSRRPTNIPSISPSRAPTVSPTFRPSSGPTVAPSRTPTQSPTIRPTGTPTNVPSRAPTRSPTFNPSKVPTIVPTSRQPTVSPSRAPTRTPSTRIPSSPTLRPTSTTPTMISSARPSPEATTAIRTRKLPQESRVHGQHNQPKMKMADMMDEIEITYDMACIQKYPTNPRLNLQMSLFCMTAFFDRSPISAQNFESEYAISKPCDTIVRSTFNSSLTTPYSSTVREICSQDLEADTCTVNAAVYTFNGRTCKSYCEGFPGLTCVSAAYSYDNRCSASRTIACTAQSLKENYLLCTCGFDGDALAKSKSLVPSQPLNPSCSALIAMPTSKNLQLCAQNFESNSCRVYTQTGGQTCDYYCGSAGLVCLAGADNSWQFPCKTDREWGCDAQLSDQICTCGPAPAPAPVRAVTALEKDINNPVCERIALTNHQSRPLQYCPSTLFASVASDSCTVRVYLTNPYASCDAYCKTIPGLKCVGAVRENAYGCASASDASLLRTCSEFLLGNSVCKCALDDDRVSAELAVREEPTSKACINLALGAESSPFQIGEFCYSNATSNTCVVTAFINARKLTCAAFCANYESMICISAYSFATDKDRIYCKSGTQVTCDTGPVDSLAGLKCECGFIAPDAYRAQNLYTSPILAKNVGSCPAYIYNNISDYRSGYSVQVNEISRTYQKVTLKLAVGEKGSIGVGKMTITTDYSDDNRDSYNTNNVEVCTGLETTVIPGVDSPEKCSFGNRLSAESNCYGKLEMDFASAQKACAKRNGHIVRIDSMKEYEELSILFARQSIGIGLHEPDGLGFQWDGYPGCGVSDLESAFPSINSFAYLTNDRLGCFSISFLSSSLRRVDCGASSNWICEGRRSSEVAMNAAPPTCAADPDPNTIKSPGGDLLSDEGGFCLWYLDNPRLELPDDESGGFRNTEIVDWLAFSPDTKSKRYIHLDQYGELVSTETIFGHSINEANWENLTRNHFGQNSTDPVVDKIHESDSFHCHFSPTNFGISRIYLQQHMLERIYPGAFKKHCFCGYKHIGKIATRCDCTLNGNRNSNCRKEHRPLLYTATSRENGAFVYCNNGQCDEDGL